MINRIQYYPILSHCTSKLMKYLKYVLIITIASCSRQNSTIDINANSLAQGTNIEYIIEQTNIDMIHDSILNVSKLQTHISLDIKSKIKDSTIIHWTIYSPESIADSLLSDFQKLIGDTIKLNKVFTIEYSTSWNGEYRNILNWDVIFDFSDSLWIKNFQIDERSSPLSQLEIDNIKSAFTTRTYLEPKISKNIMLVHYLYGLTIEKSTLSLEKPCEYCKYGKLKIEVLDDNLLYPTFRITYDIDSLFAMSFINGIIGNIVNTNNESFTGSIKDTVLYRFDSKKGFPIQIESWRMITSNDRINQQSTSIKVKEPPAIILGEPN